MKDSDLIGEVARRSGVSCETAKAVLAAAVDLAREEGRTGAVLDLGPFAGLADGTAGRERVDPCSNGTTPTCYVPSPAEVDRLIAAAGRHPLGLQFLLEGQLCAVATMFRTHAFTVEAARQRLAEPGAQV